MHATTVNEKWGHETEAWKGSVKPLEERQGKGNDMITV